MSKIVILGDSHSLIYKLCNLDKYFSEINIHHTDWEDISRTGKYTPYIMNTISNRGETLISHYLDKYKNYDYIMFIFGEPDVRIHFDKQINELNRDENEVIETLTTNYIKKLIYIVPQNVKIIVRYILPQREKSMFKVFDGIYSPKGELVDRVRYTNKINNKLKEKCIENNILFFENVNYNLLVKNSGELKDEYVDSMTHYNNNCIDILNNEIDIFMSTI